MQIGGGKVVDCKQMKQATSLREHYSGNMQDIVLEGNQVLENTIPWTSEMQKKVSINFPRQLATAQMHILDNSLKACISHQHIQHSIHKNLPFSACLWH